VLGLARHLAKEYEKLRRDIPLGRFAEPEDISAVVLFRSV
jgi:NAD(P)-dependent dehydrogenase (short-subunit alcohol dehydrogenase family)